jgi:hypothetical protein
VHAQRPDGDRHSALHRELRRHADEPDDVTLLPRRYIAWLCLTPDVTRRYCLASWHAPAHLRGEMQDSCH